jgi:hypothetical protein
VALSFFFNKRNILGSTLFVLSCLVFFLLAKDGPWLSDKARNYALYLEKLHPHNAMEGKTLVRLRFEKGLRNEAFLKTGFSTPEFWGSWTDDTMAVIELPAIDLTEKGTLFLRTLVDGYVYPPKLEKQSVDIFLNNHKLARWIFTKRGKQIKEIEIPQSLFDTTQSPRLSFSIPNATQPKQVGESEDSRKLGLGFTWLEIVQK